MINSLNRLVSCTWLSNFFSAISYASDLIWRWNWWNWIKLALLQITTHLIQRAAFRIQTENVYRCNLDKHASLSFTYNCNRLCVKKRRKNNTIETYYICICRFKKIASFFYLIFILRLWNKMQRAHCTHDHKTMIWIVFISCVRACFFSFPNGTEQLKTVCCHLLRPVHIELYPVFFLDE